MGGTAIAVVDGAGAGLRGYGELDDDAVAGALWARREGGAQRKNDRPLLELQKRITPNIQWQT